ncbi:MAG: sulfite exporter TauE/SafE family protein [Thermoleophilia bacterium]
MENAGQLFFSFLIILSASLVQGATAFGFALISVPLLLLFMPTVETVTLSLVLASVLNMFMIRDEWQAIAWREVGLLLPGSAVGAALGMIFLKSFDGPSFKAIVAAAILMMALAMLRGRSWHAGSSLWLRQVIGTLSGILMGSTSMGGPPVVLYLAGRGMKKTTLRGTLALFFLLGNLFALAAFVIGGLFSFNYITRSLILLGALLPGYAAGRRLTARLDSDGFRKLVLVSMATIALAEIALNLFS